MASRLALISFLLAFYGAISVSTANYGLLEVLQGRKEREAYQPLAQNPGRIEATTLDLPHQVDSALERRRLRRNQSQSIMLQVNVYNAGAKGKWEKHKVVLPLMPYVNHKQEEHARFEETTVLFHESVKSSLTYSEENQTTASPNLSSASPNLSSASPKLSSASPKLSSAFPKLSSAFPKLPSASPKLSSASPTSNKTYSAIPTSTSIAKENSATQPSTREKTECVTKRGSATPRISSTSNTTSYATPQKSAVLRFQKNYDGYKNATSRTSLTTTPTTEPNDTREDIPRESTTPGTPKTTCHHVLLDLISTTTHIKTKPTKLSGCICDDDSSQQLKHDQKISGGTLSPFRPKGKLEGCSNGPCQVKAPQSFAKKAQDAPRKPYKFDSYKKNRPTLARLDSYRKPMQDSRDYYDDAAGKKLEYLTLPIARRTWKKLANDLDYEDSDVYGKDRGASVGRLSQNAWKKFARKTMNVLTEDVNDVNRWDRLGVR